MNRRTQAIVIDSALRATAGFALGLPFTAAVAATGVGRFPEGDRLLFEPGGLLLAETARALYPALAPQASVALVLGVLLSLGLLLPHSALLVAFASRDSFGARAFWGRACERLPTLVSLSGVALLGQALTLTLAASIAGAARAAIGDSQPMRADGVALGLFGVGVLGALALGILRDACRAAAVARELHTRDALGAGLRALGTRPLRALGAWLPPNALALLLVVLGAALAGNLDVSRPEPFRLPLLALVHQLVIVGFCLCRAAWLGAAIEFVAVQRPAPSPRRA